MSSPALESPPAAPSPARRRSGQIRSSIFAEGEPMLWLTGGMLALALAMVAGLLGLVLWFGLSTFWPRAIERLQTRDGEVFMGEITREDRYRPEPGLLAAMTAEGQVAAETEMAADGELGRMLVRTGNFQITQNHFSWVDDHQVVEHSEPEWALLVERMEWGRFYGTPRGFAFLHHLDILDEKGQTVPLGDVRQQATAVLAGTRPEHGGELALLVLGSVDGADRRQLVPTQRLAEVSGLEGVAEVVSGSERAWQLYLEYHAEVRQRWEERRHLEKHETGAVNLKQERARLDMRAAERARDEALAEHGPSSKQLAAASHQLEIASQAFAEARAQADIDFARIRKVINELDRENDRFQLVMETAGEGDLPPQTVLIPMADIVRAYPANQLNWFERLGIFASRWWEFLWDEPREANSEGGVFPAIFGTVAMTLLLSIFVVPLGVLAALYLREYAKAGLAVSAVRIAVNNLAGVPSIVFGVFGLGFFCYTIGASIDQVLFSAALPNPTFGSGGLLWAALTLSLLTLPVVVVATEEALSAVPNSMREGSYACGASKWQTIRRIVLPRAMPGIMTGMILAIARGAGEVAPLMLVGAVKLAPELPVDGVFPYLHAQRSFMHLGFHIYDVGFQSQNSEAAKPMVYTTTLLLIGIIAFLNLSAIWLRTRLRRRFKQSAF